MDSAGMTMLASGAAGLLVIGILLLTLPMLKVYLVLDRHPKWEHNECPNDASEEGNGTEIKKATLIA